MRIGIKCAGESQTEAQDLNKPWHHSDQLCPTLVEVKVVSVHHGLYIHTIPILLSFAQER